MDVGQVPIGHPACRYGSIRRDSALKRAAPRTAAPWSATGSCAPGGLEPLPSGRCQPGPPYRQGPSRRTNSHRLHRDPSPCVLTLRAFVAGTRRPPASRERSTPSSRRRAATPAPRCSDPRQRLAPPSVASRTVRTGRGISLSTRPTAVRSYREHQSPRSHRDRELHLRLPPQGRPRMGVARACASRFTQAAAGGRSRRLTRLSTGVSGLGTACRVHLRRPYDRVTALPIPIDAKGEIPPAGLAGDAQDPGRRLDHPPRTSLPPDPGGQSIEVLAGRLRIGAPPGTGIHLSRRRTTAGPPTRSRCWRSRSDRPQFQASRVASQQRARVQACCLVTSSRIRCAVTRS